MKVVAINGSPRKDKNTATLLESALKGAKEKGAETEMIHLYDMELKGCVSCFACKVKNCARPGVCLYKDNLTPILEKAMSADAIIMGSPVYFQNVTGMMRSFLERLMFPVLTYTEGYKGLLDRKIPIGFIYTMNVPKNFVEQEDYMMPMKPTGATLRRLFGYYEPLLSYDTVQFDDYSKYVCEVFDGDKKKLVHDEQFPKDCENARALGISLIEQNG